MCTCPAARRAPRGCFTACCCCTRRSRANPSCSRACARSSPSTPRGCGCRPTRSTRSRSRSATPSTSSARREPDRRGPAHDLRRRDRPCRSGARRRDYRGRRPRAPRRGDALAAGHTGRELRLPRRCHRGRVPRPRALPRSGVFPPLARAPRRPPRQGGAGPARRADGGFGDAAVGRWRLVGARSLRHVRRHLPRPPRPAPHPDVGDVRRRLSPAEGLPAARAVQPGRAGAPGIERQPRGPLLPGRAVHRRALRRAARRDARAAAPRGARQAPLRRMSKRTVELELATPGLDARGQPTRVPLGASEPETEPDLGGEHLLINLGPQHPATHGVLRLVVELDGEMVVRVIPHVGYLHSGFEKLGEYRHYNQIIPLTDRTDYLSPMANNVGFALAAERLMGIEITPRCQVLRVIACEMSRIISHMVWLGTTSIDLGAFTPFLWAFQERERIYDLQEMWTGARLTTSVTRVGGLLADIPDGFTEGLRHFTKTYPKTLSEIDRVLTRNAVWAGRTQNVGVMTAEEAIDYSLSGPMLRASGVAYDVRKDKPYLDYETYDFDVVVGEHGDVYDRYLVRLEECSQSNRILQQALDRLPDGPINIADPRVILPPKSRAMNDMEAMIYHFKQVMEGVKAPVGEAYVGIENPKGELGTYLVSDGTAKPVRWRIRPPSFINLSVLPKMAVGQLLSDLIAINASVDIVMGEVDR